jgi:hypothetical protein
VKLQPKKPSKIHHPRELSERTVLHNEHLKNLARRLPFHHWRTAGDMDAGEETLITPSAPA